VCRFTNTEYAFEGVKPTKYQVITQPDLGSNVFTYAVDGENVRKNKNKRSHFFLV